MRRVLWFTLLFGMALGCEPPFGAAQNPGSPQNVPDLQKRLQKLAEPAKGKVGVAIVVAEGGDAVNLLGSKHFPMQSVYKLPIVMAVLAHVDDGQLKLEQNVRILQADLVPPNIHSPIRDRHPSGDLEMTVCELSRAAIVDSDGTASDVLLRLVKPRHVRKFLHTIGVKGIKVESTEKEMAQDNKVQYDNWATPQAAVLLLRKLQGGEGLSANGRDLLLSWMKETKTGEHRIRGLLPKDVQVADKTGSSGTEHGITAATNDVGLIELPSGSHLVVAVFIRDSRADEDVREAVIAQIARAAWDWAALAGVATAH